MIVASLAAVAVATVLLVLGLVLGITPLFYVSIICSVIAALVLVGGVRRLPAARLPEDDFDVGPVRPGMPVRPDQAIGRASVPEARPGEGPSVQVRPSEARPSEVRLPQDHGN